MRFWFIHAALIILFFGSLDADAQTTARIDTVRIGNLQPGIRLANITQHVHAKIDTLIWTGPEGANLLKYTGVFFGSTGEVRVATKAYEVSQVTFILSCRDSTLTLRDFKTLEGKLAKILGEPDERYENVFRITKWKGEHQTLALKTADKANYVSVVLSAVEAAPTPVPDNTPQELRPTRKRSQH